MDWICEEKKDGLCSARKTNIAKLRLLWCICQILFLLSCRIHNEMWDFFVSCFRNDNIHQILEAQKILKMGPFFANWYNLCCEELIVIISHIWDILTNLKIIFMRLYHIKIVYKWSLQVNQAILFDILGFLKVSQKCIGLKYTVPYF